MVDHFPAVGGSAVRGARRGSRTSWSCAEKGEFRIHSAAMAEHGALHLIRRVSGADRRHYIAVNQRPGDRAKRHDEQQAPYHEGV